jgi:hypothetical protein
MHALDEYPGKVLVTRKNSIAVDTISSHHDIINIVRVFENK